MPGLGKEDVITHRYLRNAGEPTYDVEERRYINVSSDLRDDVDIDALFTRFYQTNRWGSEETRSGTGSERSRMQQVVRDLSRLIRDLNIRSVLDAPCGDFNWMQDVGLAGVDYTGCDIVEELIEINCARYRRQGTTFQKLDFTVDPLPRADLILCRDAFVHFSYQRVSAALEKFCASGSKYLLTTSFVKTETNIDIHTGWWRPINLQRPPFCLPEPLDMLSDGDSDDLYKDKVLALWDLEALPC